ncbi:uncharacterized protein LOC135206148 isoform X1 [Macrobrachium nipponense]|uniref:uncharacterized protein LOC135206148 isoform X1 n=1 Tax=Macrobrachium nipponense TaxID=159736 RepID=UPI0030C8B36C
MAGKKHKIHLQRSNAIVWCPQDSPYSLYISLVDYQIFHKIGRTVHLHDYEDVQKSQRFTPRKLDRRTVSHLLEKEKDLEVLWFSPVDPKTNNNSFYGNVNFITDFVKFLSYCSQNSFNIYFVEVAEFKTCSATRFLFTRKRYDYLSEYDPRVFGGPWYTDPIGKHFWLQNIRRHDGKTNIKGHALEFLLEFGQDDAIWLYNQSIPMPVDHCDANTGKSRKCLKFGKTKTCPSPYKSMKTMELMSCQGFHETGYETSSLMPLSVNGKEITPREHESKNGVSANGEETPRKYESTNGVPEIPTTMNKVKRNLFKNF